MTPSATSTATITENTRPSLSRRMRSTNGASTKASSTASTIGRNTSRPK